jgi:hypothetical protein
MVVASLLPSIMGILNSAMMHLLPKHYHNSKKSQQRQVSIIGWEPSDYTARFAYVSSSYNGTSGWHNLDAGSQFLLARLPLQNGAARKLCILSGTLYSS